MDEARAYRDGFALWPEDTYEAALRASGSGDLAWRRDPRATAARFASDVLGWKEASVEILRREATSASVAVSDPAVGGRLDVELRSALPDVWSILNVLPSGEYFPSVTVRNGLASLGVELDGDAVSAEVTIGYGGTERTVTTHRGGAVRIDLGGRPDTAGHFLILYRDGRGDVVSALGTTLPAGDFVAS